MSLHDRFRLAGLDAMVLHLSGSFPSDSDSLFITSVGTDFAPFMLKGKSKYDYERKPLKDKARFLDTVSHCAVRIL